MSEQQEPEIETLYDYASRLDDETLFEQASRLDDEIKARQAELIEPLIERKTELEVVIRERCLASGETLRTAYGKVTFRAAGGRVSWDDKALLAIIADLSKSKGNAALVTKLMACRQITPTNASTAISYKGGE